MKKLNKTLIIISLAASIISFPLISQGRAGEYGGKGGTFRSPGIHAPSSGYRPTPSYRPSRQQQYYPTSPSQSYEHNAYQKGYSSGSFTSGLFTGAIGAWLYNKIFHGQSGTATNSPTTTQEQNPLANIFGEKSQQATATPTEKSSTTSWVFRIILFLAIIYLLRNLFRRRRSTMNKTDQPNRADNILSNLEQTILGKRTSQPDIRPQEYTNLSSADYTEFSNILSGVQNAWSQNNLTELQRFTSPAISNYFASILDENRRAGIKNHVEQVQVIKQELQETWEEEGAIYARVLLTWEAIDYTTKNNASPNDPDYLVNGDPRRPSTASEIWTFVRYPNSPWILAEIAQA